MIMRFISRFFSHELGRAALARSLAVLMIVVGGRTGVCGEKERPPTASKLAGFQLPDQYERLRTISFPGTNFMILTVADQKGFEQIASWIGPIKEHYAKRIEIAGVADMGKVPSFLRGFVRSKFQKRQVYPVMLDWTGKVAGGIGYTPNQARVLLLHPDGTVLLRFSGAAKPEDLRRILEALDEGLSGQAGNRPSN